MLKGIYFLHGFAEMMWHIRMLAMFDSADTQWGYQVLVIALSVFIKELPIIPNDSLNTTGTKKDVSLCSI